MNVATLVAEELPGFVPGTNLYELSTPLEGASFVAVMAVDNPGTQNDETIIVATNSNGVAFSLNRLPGSLVGWSDHGKALSLAGYEVVKPDRPAVAVAKSDADGEDGAPGRDGADGADGGVVG